MAVCFAAEHMGRVTERIEARSNPPDDRSRDRPMTSSGQLWSDDDFLQVALKGVNDAKNIEWKRPQVSEYLKKNCFSFFVYGVGAVVFIEVNIHNLPYYLLR